MSNIATILCAVDFSPSSAATLGEACQMARDRKARLIALYVAPKAVVSQVEDVSELSPEESREKLWEAIHKPYPEEASMDVEHRLEEGDPVEGILRAASDTKCDLLVIGKHSKSGWAGWFRGTTAEKVLRDAPCSVLIVKESAAVDTHERSTEGVGTEISTRLATQ